MYDQTFSENLKEFCKLMTSKLSTMKSEDLFQNEEKMVHLFESVTLFAIAGAVHLRMLKDMKSKKKSQMKLNETWMMSRKCFKKKDRRNAFLQCFPALIGLLRTKTFNGKLCARAVDEIVVFEGYHDFVRILENSIDSFSTQLNLRSQECFSLITRSKHRYAFEM